MASKDKVKQSITKKAINEIREGILENLMDNIRCFCRNGQLMPEDRALDKIYNCTIITLRYKRLPVYRILFKAKYYNPKKLCRYLKNELIKGRFDDVIKAFLKKKDEEEGIAENNYKKRGYKLTSKQKNELKGFPLLKSYIESDENLPSCYLSEYLVFFRWLWLNLNIDELELFPVWDDISYKMAKWVEKLGYDYDSYSYDPDDFEDCDEQQDYYNDFNSCGSNSRWEVVESFADSEFLYCVDRAIALAKKYGDIYWLPTKEIGKDKIIYYHPENIQLPISDDDETYEDDEDDEDDDSEDE